MKGTTEYRESYCWFYGGKENSPDRYDDLIRSKINGTYVAKQNENEVPEFSFEKRQREEQVRVVPDPSNVISADAGKDTSSRKSLAKLRAEKKRQSRKQAKKMREDERAAARSCFHNYGQGNTNPPSKELFMTTFNVKAPAGVNPHTLMKSQIRPYVMTEYARPKPIATVKMHKPAFYQSIKEAPKEQQLHMDGPFWIHWPSEKPFPQEYAALEKIVRPKSE